MTQDEKLLVAERLLDACRKGRGELSWSLSKTQDEISFLKELLLEAAEELKHAWEVSWDSIPSDSIYHKIMDAMK